MQSYIQVSTTTESKDAAIALGHILVEKKLAACIQINGPITSIFTWKDKVTEAEEWQLVIKTRDDLFSILEQAIKENHTYELPEIIGVKLEHVSSEYAKWIDEQL